MPLILHGFLKLALVQLEWVAAIYAPRQTHLRPSEFSEVLTPSFEVISIC